MLSRKPAILALAGVALTGCSDRETFDPRGDDEGDDAQEPEVQPFCEDREPTPPIERPGAIRLFLATDEPGWRYETLAPDGDGVIAAVTFRGALENGRLERWADDDPHPVPLAVLPYDARILGISPGPDAIYLQAVEASSKADFPRGVLEVRDGQLTRLHEYDDLAGVPAILRTEDALFAQTRSGAFVRLPLDGSPPVVTTVPVLAGALDGDALVLLHRTTDHSGEEPIDRLRFERMDLATGRVAEVAPPVCTDPGDAVDSFLAPSAMVVHDGVPIVNTRRAIATLDAAGRRVDRFVSAGPDLRGLHLADDGVYFFRGHRGDGLFDFYRLPHGEAQAERLARFNIEGPPVEVTGVAAIPGALYVALTDLDRRSEVWRVGLD